MTQRVVLIGLLCIVLWLAGCGVYNQAVHDLERATNPAYRELTDKYPPQKSVQKGR